MQAQHQSSSEAKAITSSRRLFTVAVIGAALIGYQVHKTPDARARLKGLANQALRSGEMSDVDAAVVTRLLAEPMEPNPTPHLFLV
ncbi:hypothetical protein A584_16173 [Pseudomonas syringae pv. theae ICMP 3923]|uniref:hypothetical protein n=1 Tax=Pseudomonas syringae group TaxID=136849 RepID=UPI000357396D|nr:MULTISPECIES: hypothetical protein [Pseudomonas syringae group]EPM68857.1 hypothetical protein A584_16173 [Pseudomonas syringae pv. theae ICMP 3923]KPZ30360.1 hypothetical protein AN901_203115 [Pseudomonas syringae pv. theae]MBL3873520.1 hypothetical protein [Pseudomonas syringae pv. theae]GKQ28311.1 hypothetical protein PSTH68_02350 [Pseudomonas syringae pv. theae]